MLISLSEGPILCKPFSDLSPSHLERTGPIILTRIGLGSSSHLSYWAQQAFPESPGCLRSVDLGTK